MGLKQNEDGTLVCNINRGYLLCCCDSSSVMKTSVFSRVRNTSDNLNFFIIRDEFLMVFTEKRVNFPFILLFTRQCALLTS